VSVRASKNLPRGLVCSRTNPIVSRNRQQHVNCECDNSTRILALRARIILRRPNAPNFPSARADWRRSHSSETPHTGLRCMHPSEVVQRLVRVALYLSNRDTYEIHAHCAHFGALVSGGINQGQAARFVLSGRNAGIYSGRHFRFLVQPHRLDNWKRRSLHRRKWPKRKQTCQRRSNLPSLWVSAHSLLSVRPSFSAQAVTPLRCDSS
jgi:hypothetical protein